MTQIEVVLVGPEQSVHGHIKGEVRCLAPIYANEVVMASALPRLHLKLFILN